LATNHVVIKLHSPSGKEMFFFFASGVIMSVPLTLFIDQFAATLLVGLNPSLAALVAVAFFVPFIEEFSKAFPLFYRHGETERSIFNLALLVGFGFGLVEFLLYVLVSNVSIIARLPGIIFHPASTSITAYGIATRKTGRYYLIAVALHFVNNFIAVASPFALPLSVTYLIAGFAALVSWQLYKKTREKIIE
jgi:RsiW-degrading membrane proteinase PrsW (M82 family)